MSNRIKHDTATDLEVYNPALGRHAFVTPEKWQRIRLVGIESVQPLRSLTANYLRLFLIAMVRYVDWADNLGYPLELARILDPDLITAYAVTPASKDAEVKMIWRLSCEAGIAPSSEMKKARSNRRSYASPYSPAEIASLVNAARAQATTNRRMTLLAVIVLGAGCGVVREGANDVAASDVHLHGSDWFVRTPTYCARVRPEYVSTLKEVATARPEGPLRGQADARNLFSRAKEWLEAQRGVPQLSADRLRSTYICDLLATSGVYQVLSWSGLESLQSLKRYFPYLAEHHEICDVNEDGEN